MPRKGHETARVGEHADKTREEAIVGQGIELPLDSLFLIEKPPATAELDFSGRDAVLKGPESSRKDVVVGGVDVIQNRFWQRVFAMQQIEIFVKRLRLWPVA